MTEYEAPRIGVLMGRRLRDAAAVQAIAAPIPFPYPGVRKGT